jgi:glycosyltransferase involved in cell wall biosynthesis
MHFAIVTYLFAPSKNIGGRRWSKFSRQLQKKEHQVTVVTTENEANKDWYTREFSGIEVNLLPKRNPDWMGGHSKNFGEKIMYFFYTKILNLFTLHNIYDRGSSWEKEMLNSLEDLHKRKPIDVLIVTGGPFSLLHFGSKFKKKHREIIYISDFRDPWTWGNLYGMNNLSKRKKKFQELAEYQTIQSSDMVCYPTKSMGDFLSQKYPNFSFKLNLLPHAYDPEKFPKSTEELIREGFIYGGTIYSGLEEIFLKLEKIVLANPDSNFSWDIYTRTVYPLINKNFGKGRIKLHSFVSEEELFNLIKKSSAYLIFFSKEEKDLISTKFYEIIYTGTPIIYVGEKGEVGKFITENKLGIHILPENLEQELPIYLNGIVPFEKGYFDVSQYSFSKVTEKFLNDIQSLKLN